MLKKVVKNILKFIAKNIARFIFRLEIEGIEKIPLEGPLLVVANHHSYLDPPLLIIAFPREIYFIAKKELFTNIFTAFFVKMWDCIPIDRKNPQLSTFKKIFKYLEEGKAIGIFPEGTRVKDPSNFGKAEPGVSFIISKFKTPVLISYIEGTYQWYKKFKVKVKFKELILPEELLKIDNSQIANYLMKKVYNNEN